MAHRSILSSAMTVLLLAALPASARGASTREARPLTLSGAANGILPSIGLDLSYQVADRFGLGAQITSLLWAHIDLSLRSRFMAVAHPTWGLYLGANVHGWYSPIVLESISPAATGELGYEYRSDTGFTVGAGLGAGALYLRKREGRGEKVEPLVLANLRIGRSW